MLYQSMSESEFQHLRPPKPKRPMGFRETFLLFLRPPLFWLSNAAVKSKSASEARCCHAFILYDSTLSPEAGCHVRIQHLLSSH